jgi:hypothetical protein
MRKALLAVALVAASTMAAGCDSITTPDFDEVGTVRFVDLEGGCWVIETETETLLPLDLAEAARVDGLVVTFEANRVPDAVTFCQLGIPVEILRIRQLDD